jgi:predicted signal transduction protein with EAL and GGDEF domain
MVARLGGDEFVVLLDDVPDAAKVAVVAEKLIAALSSSLVIAGREVHVTASIGICSYPQDAQDMRTLMKYADIAMYRAKEQGRNTFQFYSAQFNVHSVERLTRESQLRGVLERDELLLNYQPVIDARSGRITGMEALVRWQNPQGGLLQPGQFISIAEDTGLIVPIGAWVLRTACAQQRAWLELGLPPVSVAVNLSPRQFAHRYLVEDIQRVLQETQCDTRYLELEITEGTVMHNALHAIELLTKLKQMGIRISIDDFGTGYSSLSYLKRFPIDTLKIDRSFVTDVPHDSGNTAITRAILAMAHSLGLKVVGEGVETSEQHEFLRENGCDEMQGYFFSPPVGLAQATALLTAGAQGALLGKPVSSSRTLRIAS